jgi:hypothetical protein
MIDPIVWPKVIPYRGEFPSPFIRGDRERPLRLTFHTSSFTDLSPEETEALETLLQLANHSEIEAVQTEAGPSPYLEIGNSANDNDYTPITVRNEDGISEWGIPYPDQWLHFAAHLVEQTDLNHPDVQGMYSDLLIARAHYEIRHDLLITCSPRLISQRTTQFIREANPRTPSEAIKIVGLFLRSRDDYSSVNRGPFYWILARHCLPSMWRYFSACIASEAIRGDDIAFLGQSILTRCVRTLEARDAIGIQFYVPQNNDTRSTIMYHFDYLTLLLSGAFDAEARVAHRAYNISKPSERHASFRRLEFLNALKDAGAYELHELASSQYFRDVMTLLHELRNTIHGAGLPPLAVESRGEPQTSFVKVLPQYKSLLWNAAQACGSPERWGLIKPHDLRFEPYTYCVTLVQECFKLIDAVAAATNVTGLFPSGSTIPDLRDGPPEDEDFSEERRKRFAILAL